jgi:hypothetical protein|tara:strand:+ start:1857 stop:2324 length:468 start_codon:yes stop_codon:yes gene_type:complete
LSTKSRKYLVKHIFSLIGTLNEEEKQKILNELLKKRIPISAFKAKLSGLEIIIKYLKEAEKKSFKEISKILNRKLSTIYNTYNKSKIKFKKNLDLSDTSIKIPYNIFANRKYSILESIVFYLKDKQKLSLIKISLMLNKSYSTIKTVHRRYKIKK